MPLQLHAVATGQIKLQPTCVQLQDIECRMVALKKKHMQLADEITAGECLHMSQ